MSFERTIIDIETTNLLEPMIDYSQRPLALNDSAKIWVVSLKCVDTNNNISLINLEILEDIRQGKYVSPEKSIEKDFSELNIKPLTKENLDIALANTTELIAHNGIKFDFPALKLFELLDYQIGYMDIADDPFKTETLVNGRPTKIIDTLIWSKLLNADRGGHGLAWYGQYFGNAKMDFHTFDEFSKLMVLYCEQDLSVTRDVYNLLMSERGDYDGWNKAYALECKIADLAFRQENFGFYYDSDLSEFCKQDLDKLLEERYNTVSPNIPPRPLNKTEEKFYTPPKTKWSKSANRISAAMQRFIERVDADYDPFENTYTVDGIEYDLYNEECVKKSLPADIKDLAHLKSYLIDLGWVPSQWNLRDLTKDSKKKTLSPKKFEETLERYLNDTFYGFFKEGRLEELGFNKDITEDEFRTYFQSKYDKNPSKPLRVPTSPPLKVGAAKELCPNLETLADNGTVPFIKDIVEYFTYTHRRNSISGNVDEETGEAESGFESYVRADGRISTPVDTNATNTGRMAHKVVCNIPRPSSLYGDKIRALFGAGHFHLQFGYDFSSLEARVQGHYCLPYNGEELAKALISEKPNDIHTKNAEKLGISRSDAKAISYACLYGASAEKLAKMMKWSLQEGEKLHKDYWDSVMPLQALRDKVEAYWEKTGNKYIIGIDGRLLMARSKHSLLNLLFQSAGSIAVKYTVMRVSQLLEKQGLLGNIFEDTFQESLEKVYQMIVYHDEVQHVIPKSFFACSYFETEEEAEDYKKEHKLPTTVHFSEKMNKYYVEEKNILNDIIEEAIQNTIENLNIRVDLNYESSIGNNWADCH